MTDNKKTPNNSLIIGLVVGVVAVICLTAAGAFIYLNNREPSATADTQQAAQKKPAQVAKADPNNCTVSKGKNYVVTIENSVVTPQNTDAKLCDTITFINKDSMRLLTFGVHDQHVTYNGITEKELGTGQSLTITLDAEGTIPFHDHDQDEVEGVFTVTKN